jgi:hypothetical protein
MKTMALVATLVLAAPTAHAADKISLRAARKEFKAFLSKVPTLRYFHEAGLKEQGVKVKKAVRAVTAIGAVASTIGGLAAAANGDGPGAVSNTFFAAANAGGSTYMHLEVRDAERRATTATIHEALSRSKTMHASSYLIDQETLDRWAKAGLIDQVSAK